MESSHAITSSNLIEETRRVVAHMGVFESADEMRAYASALNNDRTDPEHRRYAISSLLQTPTWCLGLTWNYSHFDAGLACSDLEQLLPGCTGAALYGGRNLACHTQAVAVARICTSPALMGMQLAQHITRHLFTSQPGSAFCLWHVLHRRGEDGRVLNYDYSFHKTALLVLENIYTSLDVRAVLYSPTAVGKTGIRSDKLGTVLLEADISDEIFANRADAPPFDDAHLPLRAAEDREFNKIPVGQSEKAVLISYTDAADTLVQATSKRSGAVRKSVVPRVSRAMALLRDHIDPATVYGPEESYLYKLLYDHANMGNLIAPPAQQARILAECLDRLATDPMPDHHTTYSINMTTGV